jgi:GNAT superfamily N-acetyltransferase
MDPACSIRATRPADAVSLQLLATQVFVDTYAADGIGAAVAQEVRELLSPQTFGAELATPGSHVLIAEKESRLVGFAHVIVGAAHPLDGIVAAELRRLYVLRHFLGLGVGARLLQESEARVRAEGVASLWLTAWFGNARALAFYARQGFVDQGSVDYRFAAETFENRVLAKALIAPA